MSSTFSMRSSHLRMAYTALAGATLVAGFLWILPHGRKGHSLGPEVGDACRLVDKLHAMERMCVERTGKYASLAQAQAGTCGHIAPHFLAEPTDGFRVSVEVRNDGYIVKLYPNAPGRFLTFYSDETRVLRWGTKDRPAGPYAGVASGTWRAP